MDDSSDSASRNETDNDFRNGYSSSGAGPEAGLFVEMYEWSEDNLPIGVSFDSDYRIPTPEFMRNHSPTAEAQEENQEGAQEPTREEPQEESQVETRVTTTEPQETEVIARVDHSNIAVDLAANPPLIHHEVAARTPFLPPRNRPTWTLYATDFQAISAIPSHVMLWCPGCIQALPGEDFRMAAMDENPVETCTRCRDVQMQLPDGLMVCWSYPNGCGRLLPTTSFSRSFIDQDPTRVFCDDCRACGHNRARLEGRV